MIITKTANAITLRIFKHNIETYIEVQIILRLYKTVSEVLHGFDVDCCALGFDENNIWASKRAIYSLFNGYNTVNFDRLSPSYEFRLAKYGTRGISIKIPDFNINKIKKDDLDKEILDSYETIYNTGGISYTYINTSNRYKKWINELRGLDILIYLNHIL